MNRSKPEFNPQLDAPEPPAQGDLKVSPPPQLLALTLHQPWAAAIRDLGKSVENRSWRPPAPLLGQHLAIHAGKTFDDHGAAWIAAHFGMSYTNENTVPGAVIALARVVGVTSDSLDPWFFGPYGWVLDQVIPLTPVACRGARHLWPVPAPAVARIREQLSPECQKNLKTLV